MKELEDMRNDELFTTVVIGIQILRDNERKQGYEDGKAETPFTDTEEAEKKAYERGLNEAWDVAKKIYDMDGGDLVEVFNDYDPYNVTQKYTATEAVAKIKEYEDKQKQDAEIKAGDEVYSEMYDLRFIVTRLYDGRYEGVCTDGAAYCPLPDDVKKTGRHTETILKVLGEFDEKD